MLIVNLQDQGEHPSCGPNGKLEASGFSYNLETFTENKINIKLAGWVPMSDKNAFYYVLDIVRSLDDVISKGSMALVHCHGGEGKSGIIAACYLITYKGYNDLKAIKFLKEQREQMIGKKSHERYISTYYTFFRRVTAVVSLKKPINVTEFVKNQMLFDNSTSEHRFCPLIVNMTLSRLSVLRMTMDENIFFTRLVSMASWTEAEESELIELKLNLNKGLFKEIMEVDSPSVLTELLFDWIEDDVESVIEPEKIRKYIFESGLKGETREFYTFTSDEFLNLERKMKKVFNKIECHTLKKLAAFFNILQPSMNNTATVTSFKAKLATSVLGFSKNESKILFEDQEEKRKQVVMEFQIILDLLTKMEAKEKTYRHLNGEISVEQSFRNDESIISSPEKKEYATDQEIQEILSKIPRNKLLNILNNSSIGNLSLLNRDVSERIPRQIRESRFKSSLKSNDNPVVLQNSLISRRMSDNLRRNSVTKKYAILSSRESISKFVSKPKEEEEEEVAE